MSDIISVRRFSIYLAANRTYETDVSLKFIFVDELEEIVFSNHFNTVSELLMEVVCWFLVFIKSIQDIAAG